MKSNLSRWDRLSRQLSHLVVLCVVLAAMLGVALWYLPMIQQNHRLQREILELQANLEIERNERDRLLAELVSYEDEETERRMVIRMARVRLRYSLPSETVYRFVPTEADSETSPRNR